MLWFFLCEEWAPENPDTQFEVAKADKVTRLDKGGPQGIKDKGKRTKWKGPSSTQKGSKGQEVSRQAESK